MRKREKGETNRRLRTGEKLEGKRRREEEGNVREKVVEVRRDRSMFTSSPSPQATGGRS